MCFINAYNIFNYVKIYEKCGTDFLQQECGITSAESIKVRNNIPKDKLTSLDR